jgi:hypothetical protein
VLVNWPDLAEFARTALERLSTLEATIATTRCPSGGSQSQSDQRRVSFHHPDSWRVETEADGVVFLRGSNSQFRKVGSRDLEREPRPAHWFPASELADLGWGQPELFGGPQRLWKPDSDPQPAQVIGRPAYQVTFQDAPGKPFGMTLAIDADTGLILSSKIEHQQGSVVTDVVELVLDRPEVVGAFAWESSVLTGRTIQESLRDATDKVVPLELGLPQSWPAAAAWILVDLDPATGEYLARLESPTPEAFLWRRPPAMDRRRHPSVPAGYAKTTSWEVDGAVWTLFARRELTTVELKLILDQDP